MFENTPVTGIAHVIQLAVAPVFLLTGIGAILAVMTGRLARIVDRSRALQSIPAVATIDKQAVEAEMTTLSRRAAVVSRAISLCTLSALLVSAVIGVLFLGAFADFDTSILVGMLFISAMLAMVVALLYFLREVRIATASLCIDYNKPKESG